jgi:hypothetical protein
VTEPGGSGQDLIGDFQRWLLRTGARGMSRQLTHQVRTALGRNQEPSGDVWETATTEPLPGEAPECAWCPLCRAARLVREAKPGRDTRVTAVGDALNTVVQDAVSVLESALAATGRGTGPNGRRDETGPGTRGFAAAGEAAAGGKAAPSRDKPAAPAKNKQAPPATDKQAAPPATDEQAPPAKDEQAAPATDKPAAPAKNKQAPPAKDKQAAPATDKPAAPAKNKQAPPAPAEESPDEPDDRG